jgi:predicted ATPase
MSIARYEQSTHFIGRTHDITKTSQLLNDSHCRLLTLVGVGGIGKTRLALQVSKEIQGNFKNGIYFVNLQPVRSSEFVVPAIADAFGIALSSPKAFEEQLLDYVQHKNILLLLDNFEHLLSASDFLVQIIRHAPATKLLVTSREALNLQEEWLYPLDGLPTPMSHEVDDLESYEAIQLFIDRALHVRPEFSFDKQRAGVVRICQLVSGLPLAIEMAASWTKTLRCSEIAAEIQANINFLTTSFRNVEERHRSMQAVFTQTWGRMSDGEKELFPKLSVFRGGFGYDAAQAITGAHLAQLTSLLDKCLLSRDATGRYQVHELLRQYAEERLDESMAQVVSDAHCDYFADFMLERRVGVSEGDQVRASKEIEENLENIRAAMQHAFQQHLADAIEKFAPTFFGFAQIQSRYLEAAKILEQSLVVLEAQRNERSAAQISVYFAWMLIRLGRIQQASDVLESSLASFRKLDIKPLSHGMGSDPLSPLIVLKVILRGL